MVFVLAQTECELFVRILSFSGLLVCFYEFLGIIQVARILSGVNRGQMDF